MMRSERCIGSIITIVISTILLVGIRGSFAQESVDRSCLLTISDCMEDSSSILDCCPTIKDAIADERECFCLTKEIFGRNASHARTWSNILIFCSVTASLDSLCPDSDSSPIVPTSSSPESPPSIEPSPSESDPITPSTGIEPSPTESDPITPSTGIEPSPTESNPVLPPTGDQTPSSPAETLFPPTPATDYDTGNESDEKDGNDTSNESGDGNDTSNNGSGDESDFNDTKNTGGGTSIRGGDKNDSNANKIRYYQMVLFSSNALFIWAILLS
ncbi:uncharacterized protein LOC110692894 [Chenopodium quinoa]|uniref:uncharacterized protein LOC110692894 n=1 Tax=Chenopodium quinoa TaxID=63459 RepID=UPI000B76E9B5|nr:uncharacterized protein LOC110692894 [Chenopodium quinoa]